MPLFLEYDMLFQNHCHDEINSVQYVENTAAIADNLWRHGHSNCSSGWRPPLGSQSLMVAAPLVSLELLHQWLNTDGMGNVSIGAVAEG
jgi:hypothetical protein